MELTPRQERLLSLIVEHFIDTGEPVGSKFLSTVYGSTISSATIRNEMASLSKIGFIGQPHTSAGRIPSEAGYRYYIRFLMPGTPLTSAEKFAVLSKLDSADGDADSIVRAAAGIISGLTDCVTLVSTPVMRDNSIARAELASVGKRTAMVIVRSKTGVLRQKVCRTDEEPDMENAQLFYKIAMNFFVGHRPEEINTAMLQKIVSSLGAKALVMMPLVTALSELSKEESRARVIIAGHENVFHHRELSPYAHSILDFLQHEEYLRHLTELTEEADVTIGPENKFSELSGAAVIRVPYLIDGETVGVFTLIGPVGMDYGRVIPILKYVAGVTGKLLTETAMS